MGQPLPRQAQDFSLGQSRTWRVSVCDQPSVDVSDVAPERGPRAEQPLCQEGQVEREGGC